MRQGLIFCALLLASTATGTAQDPTGEWLVKEKVAAIRIENCNGVMWGVVSWERDAGGVDENNPDHAKRRRPTLGMPVLLGLKPTLPNRWEGEIYNAQDGKTYKARISLASANVLRVEGCLLGFLCGGEDWTRITAETRLAGRRPPAANAPPPRASDVCARL